MRIFIRYKYLQTLLICTLSAPSKVSMDKSKFRNSLILLASRAGFEPATCPLGGGCAIHLCHRDFDFIYQTQVYPYSRKMTTGKQISYMKM